jgi:FPC/CPF motif-containing protein YcgG
VAQAQDVNAALRAVLHDPDFPCLGAKSVMNEASYRFGLYAELATAESTAGLAADLFRFVREKGRIDGEFVSFVAAFAEPKVRDIATFEALLWRQLELVHQLDRPHFDWNRSVSKDVRDEKFSFSFAGNAFFVVGLSPAAPRWARRFPWPVLVFNDHLQFERLRAEGRFEPIRDTIREREKAVHGRANPNLGDYGAHSEARQYSGRTVTGEWDCPVRFR